MQPPRLRTLAALLIATLATLFAPALGRAQPDPAMQNVLTAIASFDAPPIPTLSPFDARTLPSIPEWVQQAAAQLGQTAPPQPVADVKHVLIPSRHGKILARVYTPQGPGPFPVLVYFHGGGWVVANLNTYDSTRALTSTAATIVVSVAYRQAPEHPLPAAVQDAYTAYRWVREEAEQLGGDPNRVSVGGESAGGNLAAVVSLVAKARRGPLPAHQLLVYPVTNYAFDTPSYRRYANAVPLNRATMKWFWGHYLRRRPADGRNPYASPLRARNLEGLPPATVILAEIDPLQSEGLAYAERLRAAGVPVTVTVYPGVSTSSSA